MGTSQGSERTGSQVRIVCKEERRPRSELRQPWAFPSRAGLSLYSYGVQGALSRHIFVCIRYRAHGVSSVADN